MNARDLERMQSVYDAALERPSSERESFVARACEGDDALRLRVLKLLQADEHARTGFVEQAVRAAALTFAAPDDHSGRLLGAYRLLRELGHGGMGTVWLAERADTSYRGTVAIKLVRAGSANAELARHFRHERQILADLRHPHVAALLDGGEAPDGTPYLVMEYIDGQPITAWAADHRLRLADRLRLFRFVCDAVQHAHASLVVHRDIKPSNILVGSDGVPKLLDFGIAKLLAPDSTMDTTAVGRRLTPSYASPEQLRGERVTVATDIFSLGVLLYELVASAHPFAAEGTTADEVRLRVLEAEPARPSDVLRQRAGAGSVSARSVAGDLDNIIAKAMRKEPELRYASVAQLSDDIGRMLDGQPVLARPASIGYRARKFIRRHATVVAAATLVLLVLVGGLATTLWQARRAERARGRAEAALVQANEVKNFLTGLFRANDPARNLGAKITVRELLDRGVSRADSLQGQPSLQADLLETLARVEMSLGEYRLAENLFDREVGIRRQLPVDTLLVQAINGRGQSLSNLGIRDSAAASFAEAIATGIGPFGEENDIVLAAMNNLAITLERSGRDDEAEATYRRVVAINQRVYGPDHQDLTFVLNNLALQLAHQGRYREAEPLFRESLRIRLLGDSLEQQPSTSFSLDNFGMMLREAGRYDEAEGYMRRALAIRLKTLGPDHRYTAESYFSMGTLFALRGRGDEFARADSFLHAAVDNYRRTLGPTNRSVAYPLHSLGILALHRGDPRAAEGFFREALAIRRTGTGDSPRETSRTLVRLGLARFAAGDAGYEASFREADSLARSTLDRNDPVRNRASIRLALAEARHGNRAAAAPRYASAVRALASRIGDTHPFVKAACADGAALGLTAEGACSRPR
jgi:serine/threonine-protein kinase